MDEAENSEPPRRIKLPEFSSMTDEEIDEWAGGAWSALVNLSTSNAEHPQPDGDA